jgi:hypothetical protein
MITIAGPTSPQQFCVSSSTTPDSQLARMVGGNQVTTQAEPANRWVPQYAIGAVVDERGLIGPYCKWWISLACFLKLTITIADASTSQRFKVSSLGILTS